MKTSRIIIATLTLLWATPGFVASARPEAAAETVSQPGVFSYKAPSGWKVMTLPAIRNPIAIDGNKDGFSPYIQVDQASSAALLADFSAANKASLKKMFPSTKFVDEKPFATAAGVKGIRIVVTSHVGENDLKAIYFMFEGSKKVKFVILSNCLASSFDKYAPIFDAAMKTFVCE